MNFNGISTTVLQRLPVYLCHIKALPKGPPDNISATAIAAALGLGEVQVRKDLASVSMEGKPKIGYIKADLIDCLEEFLGYKNTKEAVIVGAGRLGKALLEYAGFNDYGMNINMAFDINSEAEGEMQSGKRIFDISKFENLCRRMNIKIGIITVPVESAQEVCDQMVKVGIMAILNFAPVHLTAPDDVFIENQNIAVSLALLSGKFTESLNNLNSDR